MTTPSSPLERSPLADVAPESSDAEAAALALVGTTIADRYRLEELVGRGGMGTVYRAQHVHMRKAVALKILNRDIAALPEVSQRFEREAIAAARIEHRNVAKAMDFGHLPDGGFYFVLELVRGHSLTELLAAGPLPPTRALGIARQIADAMVAAHEAGIVHRDLKPDNVMLTERDEVGDFVKVLDFGVAKLEREDSGDKPITSFGAVIGTPEYMAPEQAGGAPVDQRADLYALGVILYEMLAGRPPFTGENVVSLVTAHLTEPPPPLPETIDPGLCALVDHLLAKEPEQRLQTAAELVAAIDQAQAEIDRAAAAAAFPDITLAGTARESRASGPRRPRWLVPAVVAAGALGLVLVGVVSIIALSPGKPALLAHSDVHLSVPALAPPPAPAPSASEAKDEPPPEGSAVPEAQKPEPAPKVASKSASKAKPKSKPASSPPPKKKKTFLGIYVPPPSQW